MKQKAFLFALVLCSFTFLPGIARSSQKARVEITFTGLRNGTGHMLMGVNNSADGWPRKPLLEYSWKKNNGSSEQMIVVIEELEYGSYAFSILDDETSNGDMDFFLGIPQEGYGFSRDPRVRMSAPKFDDCVIEVKQPLLKLTIPIHYFQKNKR